MQTGCRTTEMADTLDRIYTISPSLNREKKDARNVVCADGDLVMNEMSRQGPLPLGFSKDINYTFANAEFLSNCLDYCTNPSGLLEARAKDYSLRLLDPEKTEDERTLWQFINVAVPLIGVVFCGLIFQYIRKRKYGVGGI